MPGEQAVHGDEPVDLIEALRQDVALLFTHLRGAGKPLSRKALEVCRSLPTASAADLSRTHAEFLRSAAPATPRSIRGSAEGRRMVGRMGGAALGAVVLLVALNLVPSTLVGAGVLEPAGAISAGFLGANFYNLYRAHRHLVELTFDPEYAGTYRLRLILGTVAGCVLVIVAGPRRGGEAALGSGFDLQVVALLAGYSVELVTKALDRLVETFSGLIAARADEQSRAAVERAELDAQASVRRRAFELSADLVKLQAALASGSGTDPTEAAKAIGREVERLLSEPAPGS